MSPGLSFGALAAIGALFAMWRQIRRIFGKVVGLFIGRSSIDDSPLAVAIRGYVFHHVGRSVFSNPRYLGLDAYVRSRGRVMTVGAERGGDSRFMLWRGRWPLHVAREGGDEGGLTLRYIRGTVNPEEFVKTALQYFNDMGESTAKKRYCVKYVVGKASNAGAGGGGSRSDGPVVGVDTRLLEFAEEDIGPECTSMRALDGVILARSQEWVLREARLWRSSEQWYRTRGIPWRRGWLLHGRPGTGKTTLARSVAEELDLPVYCYDLNSLTNDEFRVSWQRMLRDTPCLALVEDVDNVYAGRVQVGGAEGVSFDVFLNSVDGIERTHGVFLILTTNCIESVDAAIGSISAGRESRPGRIDRIIELREPGSHGLERVCDRVFPDAGKMRAELIQIGLKENDTVAQFQERCAREALKSQWSLVAPPVPVNGQDHGESRPARVAGRAGSGAWETQTGCRGRMEFDES